MRFSGWMYLPATLLLALLSSTLHAANAGAQDPARRRRANMEPTDPKLPLHLKSHIVNVDIQGRVAKVIAESIYHNDAAVEIEATYIFPLPDGATVEKFIMWMNGEPVEAKVGEKTASRQTYESIVNRKRDPGLVEQVSEGVFKMRVYPVPAGGDQKVRIEYSHVLPISSNGTILTYNYPLSTDGAPDRLPDAVAKNFALSVSMEMEGPIASVESATHKIAPRINDEEPQKARASIEALHTALDRDFTLQIKLKERASAVSVLTYRPAAKDGTAEDGTLMLMITPEMLAGDEILGKDVIMVMDTSGSMGGEKINQAREALSACLEKLRPVDRFAIISFSDEVSTFHKDWCDADVATIRKAQEYVRNLYAAGSTNIEAAIKRALKYEPKDGRLRQILFATDGCPTVGETDIGKLVELATVKGDGGPPARDTRFFTFGIGYDVNTILLDKIAALTRSERTYVRPEENIQRKVTDLCDRIAAPVLTDVNVKFSDNLEIQSVYPQQTGDLYLGRQAVIMARYKAPGKGSVTVRGKRAGKEVAIEAPINVPETTGTATSYLPKQWALRKVGFLLDQMRMNGESREIKDEVIRLGTTYSIVTPYTSYLALEKQDQHRYAEAGVASAQQRTTLSPRRDTPPTDQVSRDTSDVIIPPDILARAQLGDRFETVNPDRPDTQSAFGDPASTVHSSRDTADGGGGSGDSLDAMAGLSAAAGSGSGWGGGNGTGTGVDTGAGRGSFGIRTGGSRRLMVKRYGGSKATEAAVDAALRWIAFHQEADGHWSAEKWGGKAESDLGVAGLSLLSMLGAGHSEKVGEYKDNVKRAIAWLKSIQQLDGRFLEGSRLNDSQIVAAVALAEATGMANVAETRDAAQRAIDSIVSRSGELLEGRIVESSLNSKRFSIAWYLLALKTAKAAGLKVGHTAFEQIAKFLDGCEQKDVGFSRYTNGVGSKDAPTDINATAAALLCRVMLGTRIDELDGSIHKVIEAGRTPTWPMKDVNYGYFGTLTAFQQGGELWKMWNEDLKTALVANQSKAGEDAGSWSLADDATATLGKMGQTAYCALMLEVYYRYQQQRTDPAAVPPPPPADPAAPGAQTPVQRLPRNADTGRDGVDYSEYIRELQEGVDPSRK